MIKILSCFLVPIIQWFLLIYSIKSFNKQSDTTYFKLHPITFIVAMILNVGISIAWIFFAYYKL